MNTPTKTESPRKVENPLPEMREWLDESATRCESQRWFGALFRFNVAKDIMADVSAFLSDITQRIYGGEQAVREAVRLQREAQAPDSPGGINITPAEAKPISNLLTRAADTLHDVGEAARA